MDNATELKDWIDAKREEVRETIDSRLERSIYTGLLDDIEADLID